MNYVKKRIFIIFIILFMALFNFTKSFGNYEKLITDFTVTSIDGKKMKLSDFKAKGFLLVNVASKCGFTKQYDDLQKIWTNYKDKGFVVLGFPSNQFGGQEPGTNSEIKDFCEVNFNITFPIVEKTDVKGDQAHEIYKWALKNYGNSTIPKWNFHKILINSEGKVEETFLSFVSPTSKTIVKKIEKILN